MRPIARFLPVAAASLLVACATTPPPAPAPVAPASAPEPAFVASVPSFTPPIAPLEQDKPVKAKTKPGKKADKSEKAEKPDKPVETALQPVAEASAPVSPPPLEAKPKAPIKGPAWLSKCVTARDEGGAILCDADSLLANPSANVKVYAREEKLAGPVANGGRIEYRPGLPRRYRLFVVP